MIRYCPLCAAPVSHRVPPGDTLPRHVCDDCGHIQYENPRLVVGCICTWEDSILLCRRAIEPRHGFWTLPAGFMENGETTAQAAARETLEEACAVVVVERPFALVNVARIHQVHLFYLGHLPHPSCAAGSESLEVTLAREDEIPWSALAFQSVSLCLRQFFADRQRGAFGFHCADIEPA